jgi:hypothetical protein
MMRIIIIAKVHKFGSKVGQPTEAQGHAETPQAKIQSSCCLWHLETMSKSHKIHFLDHPYDPYNSKKNPPRDILRWHYATLKMTPKRRFSVHKH